jgi:hypothetical protein
MKYKLIVFYSILTWISFSCNNNNKNVEKYRDFLISSVDTISIDISGNELPYYYKSDSYIDPITNHMIFVGYNHFEHNYNLFDINEKKLIKKIQLVESGPNGISMNGDFKFINADTIIIRNNHNYLIKIDTEGKIISKTNLFDILKETEFLFTYGLTVEDPENNLSLKNDVLVSYVLPQKSFFWEKEFYEKPLLALLSPNDKTVKFLNIKYPKQASPDNLFGYLLRPYTLVLDDELIYNFPFSSKVYKYNFSSMKMKETDIQSRFTENISNTLNFNKFKGDIRSIAIVDHSFNSLNFHKLVYDPYKKVFYRIHNSIPFENEGKKIRNYYLCVFDSSFHKIGEIELEKNLFIHSYFPTQKGILIQIMNNDNLIEINKLKFYQINFDI